jgi:hypothetical protein
VLVVLADGGFGVEFQAAAAIVLWWAVIVGLGFGLWPRSPVPRPALAAGGCLGGLALLTGLSMAWASDDGRAFAELVRVLAYLGLFATVVLASSPGSARTWLAGLALGLVALAAIATLSRLQPELFPGQQELIAALSATAKRLSYPLGYWNAVGACMAAAIVLLSWFGAAATSRLARSAAVACVPVAVLGLFLTSSRGGILALAVGLAILVALDRRRVQVVGGLALAGAGSAVLIALALSSGELLDGAFETAAAHSQGDLLLVVSLGVSALVGGLRWIVDPPGRLLAVPAVGIAAVATVVIVALANPVAQATGFCEPPPETSAEARLVVEHLRADTGSGRCQYWETALDAFATRPLTGIGAGGYEAWWGEHASLQVFIRNAHSILIEMLAELGPLGLLLILGFVGVPLWAGLRGRRTDVFDSARVPVLAMLGVGTFAAAIDWMWELPAVFGLTVVAAALLSGPALERSADPARGRFGLGVLTLAAGWAAVLIGASALFTEVKIDASQDAVDRGDLEAAADAARDARALQPWAASPRLQEALVEELRGNIPAARRALDEAFARAPLDWQLWFVEARLRAAEGDVAGSLRATDRSNRLRARVPLADGAGS